MPERPAGPVHLVFSGLATHLEAVSAKPIIPEAPMGFVESTPPDMFTGRPPSSSVAPDSVRFQPSPSSAKPRFSSHIGSYHQNGTRISTASVSRRGSATPACRQTSAAQPFPACGETKLLPAKGVGSLRITPPFIQAGGRGERAAPARPVRIVARAQPEGGRVFERWIRSHSIGEDCTSGC